MKKHNLLARLGKIIIGLLIFLIILAYAYWIHPVCGGLFSFQHGQKTPITPAWALQCWVWEDDVNTAAAVRELLDGYRQHDFPVRTILIDSPWSTRYNDFQVDEKRYPHPQQFFTKLDSLGYRVVLWMTCMVDRENDDAAIRDASQWFDEARQRGFLANGGKEISWWKGRGGFIDYTNPAAMQWWHGLPQQLFNWGIDGWKLDGTATYFHSNLFSIPLLYGTTHSGLMTMRGYMNHYYRDEYQHGLSQNPQFVTLSRSLDSIVPYVHFRGFAPLDAAPVNWVGDNHHTWDDESIGLERAIRMILKSAKIGYNVLGSDIAGYHGKLPIPANLYIRWAQFSTFCGLFLNGGHGERRMWKRSAKEFEITRKFSWLHTELVPYMYSTVVSHHNGEKTLMRPLKKGTYQYLFGKDLLVAPVYRDSFKRTIALPAGNWRYFFDDEKVLKGPATITRDFPLDEYPVFIRDGAIIPMNIERDYTQIGQADWAGFLTLNIYPRGKSTFLVHHTDGSGETKVTVVQKNDLTITLDGVHKPHILRIFSHREPARVERDRKVLTKDHDWFYSVQQNRLFIRTENYERGKYTIAWQMHSESKMD